MHDRDLPRRPAEAENGDAQPHDKRFAEGDAVSIFRRGGFACGNIRHGITSPTEEFVREELWDEKTADIMRPW